MLIAYQMQQLSVGEDSWKDSEGATMSGVQTSTLPLGFLMAAVSLLAPAIMYKL